MKLRSKLAWLILLLAGGASFYGCSDVDDSGTKAKCNPDAVVSTRTDVDTSDCIAIDLSNPSSSDSRIVISEDSDVLTLAIKSASAVCLSLSGSRDGGVKVKNSNNVDVDVILNSITITSNSKSGFLKLNTGNDFWGNTYLVKLVGTSSITGAASEDSKKVFDAEPNMGIVGDGTLNITAKYKTGMGCDDVLTVYSGNINITVDRSAAAKTSGYEEKGFGIKVVNGFVMKGGTINISANDNITSYESRGIKVDGSDETSCNTGKGYIRISGGTLTVSADAKALTAGWEADEDATTSSTADDPYPDVEISGGTLNLTTTGTPRENSTNSLSPEGIEGKRNVKISGGEIVVNATDDAIQAGKYLEISGGKVFARATQNDAIDSNGTILVSGGKTVAFGASEPEGGLDADNNSNVSYTGGLLVAIGGANNPPQGSGTTGSFVSTSLGSSGSSGGMGNPGGMGGPGGGGSSALAGVTLALAADGSSDVIAAAKVPSDYVGGTNLLILADGITSGSTYYIYQSPELSPASLSWFNDALLLDSATFAGESTTSVTAGTAAGGGGGPGGNQGGPGGGDPPGGGGGPGGGGTPPGMPGQ
ncbi:MAG: carbohydrate-binding domain-containing protein [Proteobacteria bacterium]|nr:carbohydrate-binding domain-containing protein [Pseudomonadota bacterium]